MYSKLWEQIHAWFQLSTQRIPSFSRQINRILPNGVTRIIKNILFSVFRPKRRGPSVQAAIHPLVPPRCLKSSLFMFRSKTQQFFQVFSWATFNRLSLGSISSYPLLWMDRCEFYEWMNLCYPSELLQVPSKCKLISQHIWVKWLIHKI